MDRKEWRDTNARVEGPAENWQEATGELLPASDFPGLDAAQPGLEEAGEGWAAFVGSTANPELTRAERLTQLMVRAARKRLWIAQAYFTPNEALTALRVERARAGVDVRVLAPGSKNDHSFNYDALSFNMLEEGSLVLQDGEAARRMEAFFLEDLKHAREVKAEKAAR